MGRIVIRDKVDNVLSFDLEQILLALPQLAAELTWHLIDLEMVGKPESKLHAGELESRVAAAPEGVEYDWSEIMALATEIFQTYNMTLIGTRDPSKRFRFPIDVTGMREFIWIEGFDTSYWTVTSDFPEVIDAMRRRFENTEVASNVEEPLG